MPEPSSSRAAGEAAFVGSAHPPHLPAAGQPHIAHHAPPSNTRAIGEAAAVGAQPEQTVAEVKKVTPHEPSSSRAAGEELFVNREPGSGDGIDQPGSRNHNRQSAIVEKVQTMLGDADLLHSEKLQADGNEKVVKGTAATQN
ncbi:hypothetical protein M427DRAFT_28853 [Gonapodya prolifera JEL478]|uniref:Uncharacterized protein n=1 Tax=Gonapodya prolifera (strain JEL478) TaxID=1344416 RepID=A0A139ARJ7_GONPJ|nr:hypothetical protein M427DRAFT_28853 [Gonapodya prolifera JEL478]|eukprot:KXS19381.1 hypothetical protein M427DRAFT_28853 [Gonapodya prolifera JEL478]